jgi:hypothetical protein
MRPAGAEIRVKDVEHGSRGRRHMTPVEPRDRQAVDLIGELGDDRQQAALADPSWTGEPEHCERRLFCAERIANELQLGVAADEAATSARRQQIAERPHPMAARSSRQASSQARQASAQIPQCSCISACRSHSSPQALKSRGYVSSIALA